MNHVRFHRAEGKHMKKLKVFKLKLVRKRFVTFSVQFFIYFFLLWNILFVQTPKKRILQHEISTQYAYYYDVCSQVFLFLHEEQIMYGQWLRFLPAIMPYCVVFRSSPAPATATTHKWQNNSFKWKAKLINCTVRVSLHRSSYLGQQAHQPNQPIDRAASRKKRTHTRIQEKIIESILSFVPYFLLLISFCLRFIYSDFII